METVRIRFTKIGRAKYISHLDLNRFMQRVIRRSGIPAWYTEGFNSHIYITFLLPLSLGFESNCELMEIKLPEGTNKDWVKDRLNEAATEDIRILEIYSPRMKAADIAYSQYRIRLSVPELSGQALFFLIGEVLGRQTILVEKKTKKATVTLDLKQEMKDVKLSEDGQGVQLSLCLPSGNTHNINPELLLEVIQSEIGDGELLFTVERTGIRNASLELFE